MVVTFDTGSSKLTKVNHIISITSWNAFSIRKSKGSPGSQLSTGRQRNSNTLSRVPLTVLVSNQYLLALNVLKRIFCESFRKASIKF